MRLYVKEASFIHKPSKEDQRADVQGKVTSKNDRDKTQEKQRLEALRAHKGKMEPGRSYARVVQGDPEEHQEGGEGDVLKVYPVGTGWLYRSIVAKLRRIVPIQFLKGSFKKVINKEIVIRPMGGRFILLTLSSQDERDSLLNHPWMEQWLDEAKPWEGQTPNTERFVWLECYGIPLEAWNLKTFKEIGNLWGTFLEVGRVLVATSSMNRVEGSFKIEVQGKRSTVRVAEMSSFNSPDEGCCGKPGAIREEEEDDDVDQSRAQFPVEMEEAEGGKLCQVRSLVTGTRKRDNTKGKVKGSRHKAMETHLMPADTKSSQQQADDLESRVEETLENTEIGPKKGRVISNLVKDQGVVGSLQNQAHQGNGFESNLGPMLISPQIAPDSFSNQIINKNHTQLEGPSKAEDFPSIQLMVDLNDGDCRKRRRRQMVNLLQICDNLQEEGEDSDEEEDIQVSSDEILSFSQQVEQEVKATMEVGAQVNINFKPNDPVILRKMIELELKECEEARRREGAV